MNINKSKLWLVMAMVVFFFANTATSKPLAPQGEQIFRRVSLPSFFTPSAMSSNGKIFGRCATGVNQWLHCSYDIQTGSVVQFPQISPYFTPRSINDGGKVAGLLVSTPSGTNPQTAGPAVFDGQAVTLLPGAALLQGPGTGPFPGSPTAINNNDVVIGTVEEYTSSTPPSPLATGVGSYVFRPGWLQTTSLGYQNGATAINNQDQVIGTLSFGSTGVLPYLTHLQTHQTVFLDLGNSISPVPVDINDGGLVVGRAVLQGRLTAVGWNTAAGNALQTFPALAAFSSSRATQVNNQGTIAGTGLLSGATLEIPFAISNQQLFDLSQAQPLSACALYEVIGLTESNAALVRGRTSTNQFCFELVFIP